MCVCVLMSIEPIDVQEYPAVRRSRNAIEVRFSPKDVLEYTQEDLFEVCDIHEEVVSLIFLTFLSLSL